jgi:hypothetical protein
LFWHQYCSGVIISLVSALFWYQYFSGVSKVLMSAKSWCQKSSGASKILVPAKFKIFARTSTDEAATPHHRATAHFLSQSARQVSYAITNFYFDPQESEERVLQVDPLNILSGAARNICVQSKFLLTKSRVK